MAILPYNRPYHCPKHQDGPAPNPVAHRIHANIDSYKSNTCLHDGKFECFGDACNAKEVSRIRDQEPNSRCSLASYHPIAQERAPEVMACFVLAQTSGRLVNTPLNMSMNGVVFAILFSSSTPLIISDHSSSRYSLVTAPWRRRSKENRACCSLPLWRSHRGLSGTKKSPMANKAGTM